MPVHSNPICILDDDASVRFSIEQLLDSDDFQTRSFENSEDFFAHVARHPVPLVLLDVWMAHMNGLEVQSRLRELSPETKVIMMTGRETPTLRAAGLEGGAFAFVAKPFDDELFLALVRRAIR